MKRASSDNPDFFCLVTPWYHTGMAPNVGLTADGKPYRVDGHGQTWS